MECSGAICGLGHDLLAHPLHRNLANKSIQERRYLITGPVDLPQGGRSIIAREPIFFYNSSSDSDEFWGFTTVLIDLDELLNDVSFTELTKDFEVAIRGKGGLGVNGDVFIGTASTFDAALAIAEIPLQNASWQIAATNKAAGRSSGLVQAAVVWLIASIAACIAARISYSIIDRPYKLNQTVKRATESLIQEVMNRIQTEQKMRHMAQHDVLTGLPNRCLFDELSGRR